MTRNDNGRTNSGDEPTFDRETHWQQAAQRLYEIDRDGELTTAIVLAIAEAQDVSPSEVKSPPLYEVFDAPAVEKAFFGLNPGERVRNGTGSVEFRYTDYLIKVKSDGWIQIYEQTEPEKV